MTLLFDGRYSASTDFAAWNYASCMREGTTVEHAYYAAPFTDAVTNNSLALVEWPWRTSNYAAQIRVARDCCRSALSFFARQKDRLSQRRA